MNNSESDSLRNQSARTDDHDSVVSGGVSQPTVVSDDAIEGEPGAHHRLNPSR